MMRYFSEEPWGPWRDNVHTAQICALLANINRKKGTAAFSHEDFMLTDRMSRAQSRKAKVVEFFKGLARRRPKEDEGA